MSLKAIPLVEALPRFPEPQRQWLATAFRQWNYAGNVLVYPAYRDSELRFTTFLLLHRALDELSQGWPDEVSVMLHCQYQAGGADGDSFGFNKESEADDFVIGLIADCNYTSV